ncbi:MAG TPA: hypothetical protein VKP88_07110 [Candidatus Paceibacterota bacterium]|nr:hypothetical protein [Candidatus Paceibacterota bacterium]
MAPTKRNSFDVNLPKLSPDGFELPVELDRLSVGMSVFVPCKNTTACSRQAKIWATQRAMRFEVRVVIEGGLYGVRIWRVE